MTGEHHERVVLALRPGQFRDQQGCLPPAGFDLGVQDDFDVFALPVILRETGLSLDVVLDTLANKSGLAGMSGAGNDLRDIEAALVGPILTELQADPGPSAMIEHHDEIDRLFAAPTLEGILSALQADGGEWAVSQLQILRAKSPLSCKVALRQLREGAAKTSFADNMAIEFRIGARVVATHDFLEGVRAVIVDKDNKPVWDPATPAGVTDDMLDAIFAPLPPDEEWRPLADT